MAASNEDGSHEWKCQVLKHLIQTLMCHQCKAVPSSDLERSKRYPCFMNGHYLCPECRENCPCTSSVSPEPSSLHQELLEILPWFCKNYSCGCREIFADKEKLQSHEDDCKFRLFSCFLGCRKHIGFQDWLTHVKDQHNGSFNGGAKLSCSVNYNIGLVSHSKASFLSLTLNESWTDFERTYWGWCFILTAKIPTTELEEKSEMFVLRFMRKSDCFIGWIICMSSPSKARNYTYQITVKDKDGHEVTFKSKCASMDNWEKFALEQGNHYSMPASSVSRFLMEYGKDRKKVFPFFVSIQHTNLDLKKIDSESSQTQGVTRPTGTPLQSLELIEDDGSSSSKKIKVETP